MTSPAIPDSHIPGLPQGGPLHKRNRTFAVAFPLIYIDIIKEGSEMFGREKKVYLSVSHEELRMITACLMRWRNKLISEGRITDPIDEILERLLA